MNHRHRKTLHALFAHPVSCNIDPNHVRAALAELGAELIHGGHGLVMVTLNGQNHSFHDGHRSLPKEAVVALRRFLEAAGIDPANYPL